MIVSNVPGVYITDGVGEQLALQDVAIRGSVPLTFARM